VFEKRVLRKVLPPEDEKIKEDWIKTYNSRQIICTDYQISTTSSIHIFLTSSFYHFDASSYEQMRNREKWRLIIQEAKAHPELYRRGEGKITKYY
jgi:hypothetical protein